MKTASRKMFVVTIVALFLFLFTLISNVLAQTITPQTSSESLQQEKLQLEIGELKRKLDWRTDLSQSIPFVTTLVAVTGLIVSMFQNRSARANELRLRDEDHLRSDMEQLLTLDESKQTSVGKVSFLFDDLNQLVGRLRDRRKSVSDAIIGFIKEDCDFNNLRHIHVEIEANQSWSDYKEHLRKFTGDQEFVFYKYIQAFRRIHDEEPSYFEAIRYDSSSGFFTVAQYTEELRYLRFLALVRGFSLQLAEVSDAKQKLGLLEQLADALKNPTLIKQLYPSK